MCPLPAKSFLTRTHANLTISDKSLSILRVRQRQIPKYKEVSNGKQWFDQYGGIGTRKDRSASTDTGLEHCGNSWVSRERDARSRCVRRQCRADGSRHRHKFQSGRLQSHQLSSLRLCEGPDFYVNLFGMKCAWMTANNALWNSVILQRHLHPPAHAALDRPAGAGPMQTDGANGARQRRSPGVLNREFSTGFREGRTGAPRPQPPAGWPVRLDHQGPSGLTVQICATRGVFPDRPHRRPKNRTAQKIWMRLPTDGNSYKAYAVSHLA